MPEQSQNQSESISVATIASARPGVPANGLSAEQENSEFDVAGWQAHVEEAVALHLANDVTRQTIEARKFFTKSLFWITYAWLILVLLIVLAAGWKWGNFSLPASVLIALITTTTINVIAIFKGVIDHLFPTPKQKADSATVGSGLEGKDNKKDKET